jgi:hypothetical protein
VVAKTNISPEDRAASALATTPGTNALVPGFVIDRSKPPYEVPCPSCRAFALEPCKSVPRNAQFRWPPEARVIPVPHPERWTHWEAHPEFRVKGIV